MKHVCVAGQKDADARREAQLDEEPSSKPSNAADALFDRNPEGRRGVRHEERSFGAGSSRKVPRFATRNTIACAPSRTTMRETESGALSAHAFVARRLFRITKRRGSLRGLHPKPRRRNTRSIMLEALKWQHVRI